MTAPDCVNTGATTALNLTFPGILRSGPRLASVVGPLNHSRTDQPLRPGILEDRALISNIEAVPVMK